MPHGSAVTVTIEGLLAHGNTCTVAGSVSVQRNHHKEKRIGVYMEWGEMDTDPIKNVSNYLACCGTDALVKKG